MKWAQIVFESIIFYFVVWMYEFVTSSHVIALIVPDAEETLNLLCFDMQWIDDYDFEH